MNLIKNNSIKRYVSFAIFLITLLPSVLAIDQFKPYIHSPTIPEHPQLNLHGSFQTELWPGAAIYTFDLEVPPGRNGLQPSITLSYNNHLTSQRPSIVGTAWTLTQNYIWRDVDYSFDDTSDDRYRLNFNGQTYELVYVSSEDKFHTKIESFLYITNITGGSNSKNQYWIIKTKDGSSYRFGYNQDSELVSNLYSYATRWSLDLINDTHNNHVYFSYNESPTANDFNAVYPYRIEYNNEKSRVVEFILEDTDRPDKWLFYEQGNKIREARRIEEIQIKANDDLVREYLLNYTILDGNSRSFLSSITIFGSDGTTTIPPTTFEYINVTKGWSDDSTWAVPSDARFGTGTDFGVRLVDLNRDGLMDISKADNIDKETWINNGAGWTVDSRWNLPTKIVDSTHDDTGLRFVELNGDRFTDIVKADGPLTADRDAYINTGSGWTGDNSTWNLPLGTHPIDVDANNFDRGVRFVDFNGDGLIDILHNAGSTQKAYVNNGAGWTDDSDWYPPAAAEFVDSLTTPEDQGVRLADVNGDGLPDLLHGEGSTLETWLNTGNGWVQNNDYAVPGAADFADTVSGEDQGVRLADVNGDGLTDLLKGVDGNERSWVNNGQGWTEDSDWAIPTLADFTTASDGDNKGVRVADVDGDGLSDLVKSTLTSKKTWLDKAPKTYLLRVITNELGGKTTIDFKQSTLLNNTGDDDSTDIGFNLWVVDRVTENNSMVGTQNILSDVNYNYFDGFYDYEDKEFRGFENVQEIKSDILIIDHFFHQDDALKGREFKTEIFDSSANPFQRTDSNWVSITQDNYHIVELSSEDSYLFDGSNTDPKIKKKEFNYDSYGNLISLRNLGKNNSNGDERYEYWQFVYNTNSWIVDKPNNYSLFGSDNSTKVREILYRYDNSSYGALPTKGDLTLEEHWLSTGDNPIIKYNYDQYGNLIEETDAEGLKTQYNFGIIDNTFTFNDKIINAKNHTFMFTYDLGAGNLLSETDGNGNLKNYTYDVFGRIGKKILPFDSQSFSTKEYTYTLGGVAPENIKVSQREISGESGTLDTFYFYDGFGNLIQIKSEAENSQQIATDFFYDDLKRLIRQSNPYFVSSSNSYSSPNGSVSHTNYTYDALSRITKINNPDDTHKNITFDHWKIDFFDENDNKKIYFLDAHEQIIEVEEFTDTNYFITRYIYDPSGNIIQINDSYNNQINYTYDTIGRKTKEEGPDLGVWQYSYDKNNNLIIQTDDIGKTISMGYDELNRIVKKNNSNEIIDYVYDDRNGTLTKVITQDLTINYTYDNRLRKTKEVEIIDGRSFETEWSYDAMDRTITWTMPDGSSTSYNYTSQGQIEGLSSILSDITYNPLNKPLQLSYKNSLSTYLTYDENTFRISKIKTSNQQELDYTYDSVGNIINIYDNINTLNETMSYDNLYRLTSSEKTENQFSLNFTLDSLGDTLNITNNQGISYYYYGQSPKHSASKITVPLQDQNKFLIKNASGSNIAWFGDAGNIVIKGTLEQSSNFQRTNNFAFVIRNNANDVLIIENNGSMYIDGTLAENQATTTSDINALMHFVSL